MSVDCVGFEFVFWISGSLVSRIGNVVLPSVVALLCFSWQCYLALLIADPRAISGSSSCIRFGSVFWVPPFVVVRCLWALYTTSAISGGGLCAVRFYKALS
ncbi:unnamed protein product [Brassica rapa]|uniref:Uncharacterized protein n=2 Tax=Brassica TaxID=3705 RepID=A0A8D9M0L1_BRACM|nr:unnamed protein product [Brassica napus]CAG7894067.1 unnamed protein product [Brassica rapa]